MKKIRIDNPGLLTTVQDIGRRGFQRYGVSVSGAMDSYSLQLANLLVGNEPDEAALECTFMGPQITFLSECVFSLAGADMQPLLNGKSIPACGSRKALEGDVLKLQAVKSGMRAYIAFAGGLDVQPVMGSKSTYIKAAFGGYMGRKLQMGDLISIGDSDFEFSYCAVCESDASFDPDDGPIRVVLGPDDEKFTEKGMETFFGETFEISNQCDRMGYRLDGLVVEHARGADIISGGITLGAIQVPGHGHPIIMMADRQTTGGYAKIANVITVDIDRLAQMKPGDRIRFEKVEVSKAQDLLRRRSEKLARIRHRINDGGACYGDPKEFRIRLNGEVYEVSVREIINE